MTRKSRRELENAVDSMDGAEDGVDLRELHTYLDRVLEDGAEAPHPREYFDQGSPAIQWSHWPDAMQDGVDDRLMSDLDADRLTPIEAFGLQYCRADVQQAVLEFLGARRDGGIPA